jgi:hypothetical protein
MSYYDDDANNDNISVSSKDEEISENILKNRIAEKNNLRTCISNFEKTIARLQKSQEELAVSCIKDTSFLNKKKMENSLKIDELTEQINQMSLKIKAIDEGEYDEEFLENNKKSTEKFAKQLQNSNKKKENLLQKSKDFLTDQNKKRNKNNQYNDKYQDKIMEKEYERYISFIPSEHILKNLKNMPNNKGYIICGHWFFGLKPEESKNLIMFENIKGVQYIYEYYNDKIITYKKPNGSQKKIFVNQTVIDSSKNLNQNIKTQDFKVPNKLNTEQKTFSQKKYNN